MVTLDAKEDCKILVETTIMTVMMTIETKTSINVKPWLKFLLFLGNVTFSDKDSLVALFVHH